VGSHSSVRHLPFYLLECTSQFCVLRDVLTEPARRHAYRWHGERWGRSWSKHVTSLSTVCSAAPAIQKVIVIRNLTELTQPKAGNQFEPRESFPGRFGKSPQWRWAKAMRQVQPNEPPMGRLVVPLASQADEHACGFNGWDFSVTFHQHCFRNRHEREI